MKKVIIIPILLIFLVGIANAGNGNYYGQNYGQYKNGIGFTDDVNINDFTVLKNQHQIRVQSNVHYETSIKVPYSELENLEGFSGSINIIHFDDSGKNDWSKTIKPENINGYCYLDLEFSEVIITGGASPIANWNFKDWSSGTVNVAPDGWAKATNGMERSTDSVIGDYSYLITGDGATSLRGYIYQEADVEPKEYTVGFWVKIEGGTSGYLNLDFFGGTPSIDTPGIIFPLATSNTGWEWVEFTEDMGDSNFTSNPSVRIYSSGTPNLGSKIYIDGIVVYPVEINITVIETIDNPNVFLNCSEYSPNVNITDGTVTLEYPTFDGDEHPNYNITEVLFNGADKTNVSFLHDNKITIGHVTALTTSNYTINTTVNYNPYPELISPTNGSTIEREFPPLYDDVTFTWEDTGTTCQIQVAEDTSFSNVVYSGETTAATKTVSLAEGTYYWRVRSYDSFYGEYGEYPDTYNFIIVSTSSTTGNGVHGVVFEAESLGSSIPLPSALVTIYNDTYSDTAITGPEGYYQFPVANGTYIVYASLSGYDTSALLPVNVTGNYSIMNIPLIQSESYFTPHYVRFVVTDSWYWERYVGATVTVYENEDTSVLFTETTGADGAVGFKLSENVEYRIVTTYGSITQTDYISPTESTYYIVLEDIETSLLPDNQFYDIVSINITKTEINNTNARINIVYNDSAESTNSVYFVLGQTYENGTLNILDTSSTYTEDCNVTFNITGYLGQSYIIKAVIDHNDFGEVTKYFSVDFPSNNLPFTGKGVVYLCIIILFVVAAQFGKADSTQGAILLCGLTWFMWAMDIFLTFGESINTLIGLGLGISTAYALLAYINKKRTEEGI